MVSEPPVNSSGDGQPSTVSVSNEGVSPLLTIQFVFNFFLHLRCMYVEALNSRREGAIFLNFCFTGLPDEVSQPADIPAVDPMCSVYDVEPEMQGGPSSRVLFLGRETTSFLKCAARWFFPCNVSSRLFFFCTGSFQCQNWLNIPTQTFPHHPVEPHNLQPIHWPAPRPPPSQERRPPPRPPPRCSAPTAPAPRPPAVPLVPARGHPGPPPGGSAWGCRPPPPPGRGACCGPSPSPAAPAKEVWVGLAWDVPWGLVVELNFALSPHCANCNPLWKPWLICGVALWHLKR